MTAKNPTILCIHGGTAFSSKDHFYRYLRNKSYDPFDEKIRWRFLFKETFAKKEWPYIMPYMPCKECADYTAWSIWFEKHLPYVDEHGAILIGHSLGGIFLAKWLSNNTFPYPIHQLHLIGAPFFDDEFESGETLGEFVVEGPTLKKIQKQAKQVHLRHAKDDFVVPFKHAEAYASRMQFAQTHWFAENQERGHFLQPEFPELLDCIYQRDQ